jgi:uncharacterized membrane protein YcaP (DUF421 family)
METVLRGAIVYFVLMVIIRLSGRRTLAQMTPFDLILLLIVSETTQQALVSNDFSITNAVLLMATLFGIDILLSYIKRRWSLLGKVIDGGPTILVSHGEPDLHALRRSRVELNEVLEAARRTQGLEALGQIRYAVLEAGGHISIVPQSDKS